MGTKKVESGIWLIEPGKYLIKARIRYNGMPVQRQHTLRGTKEEARALMAKLKEEIRSGKSALCSLTPTDTFGELAHFYLERKGHGSMPTIFSSLIRDIGAINNLHMRESFDKYLNILKTENCKNTGRLRTETTINRYISCTKMVYNFAVKRGLIKENPITGFELSPEQGRDRIWSSEEKHRIFNVMKKINSHLYWAVYFSQWNPIRKGDLTKLTRENLNMIKPWVHFYPSKTRKRKPRETCLPFIDNNLMDYFKSLPPDCPYLFPRIDRDGMWHPLNDFHKHWKTVLRRAKVEDFHWHDLKHCAITWMLDNEFSERDLKNLGIQYDSKMIDRYYHHDANKVLHRWKKGNCASFVQTSETATG